MIDSQPPDTLPDNSIPPPYDGEGTVDGAPIWLRGALNEIRAERTEMVDMVHEVLARVEQRDERMMSLLESTLNQALQNEMRLNRVEDKATENALAISQLTAELERMKRAS